MSLETHAVSSFWVLLYLTNSLGLNDEKARSCQVTTAQTPRAIPC